MHEEREPATALLVIELQKGSGKAYDTLFWRYHQAIYRNILKFVKEHDTAQDILQDVFITLWEKRHTLDAQQAVSNWLYVVSYNSSISYLRKKLREQIALHELPAGLLTDEHAADEKLVLEHQYSLLTEALDQLSPQKRKVFTLCKIEGKSYEQAAEALKISKHTVKEYLSLATVAVKDYIRNHPDAGNKAGLIAFVCYWL